MLVRKVRITNPIENGSSITSRKRALEFVQAKRAVFVGNDSIRFIESDPRNQAATRRAAVGYNEVNRTMTRDELANLPMARPAKALREANSMRSRVYGRRIAGRSGPVRVVTIGDFGAR